MESILGFNNGKRSWGSGMQRHQLDHMQTTCTSLQTDYYINTTSLNFYRPDGLCVSQPTVLWHWRADVNWTSYWDTELTAIVSMIQHVRNCGFIIVIIDKQQYFYTDKTHTSQITGHRLATTHQHMMRPRLHQFHGKGVHSIHEHSLNANL